MEKRLVVFHEKACDRFWSALAATHRRRVPNNAGGSETNQQQATKTEEKPNANAEAKPEMITYQSENGPVEVAAQPKRIVGLTNAPNVVALGGTLVGIDE